MAHTIDSAIKIAEKYLNNRFFNPLDDENEIYSKDWRKVIGTCYNSKVVGCFSNDDRFVCFQFREITKRAGSYAIGSPRKSVNVGDIIIEISFAPHQTWREYNISNPQDYNAVINILK